MEVDLDLVRAQRLDRLVELDLAALDLDALRGGAVGDVARGDRAVELQRLEAWRISVTLRSAILAATASASLRRSRFWASSVLRWDSK